MIYVRIGASIIFVVIFLLPFLFSNWRKLRRAKRNYKNNLIRFNEDV